MAEVRVVAVDLGATSGRVMVARVGVGPDVLELDEVHRFPNGGVRAPDGSLRWDIEMIRREVVEGLRLAGLGGRVDAIGIDSWAVDYGLLDEHGELMGAPYSHRDSRTDGVAEQVAARVGAAELYAVTGLQKLPFNTVNQLVAEGAARLATARTLLLVPDLIAYWLTGAVGAERTNASTTQLLDATTGEWATGVLEALDLPAGLLPPLREPGSVIGTLTDGVAAATGLPTSVPVVAVGSHDTASAVVGVPAGDVAFAYLSSGTWSLVGLELDVPVLTEAAREADFTNEGGVDGTTRFLTNVMGLWVLSECVREWGADLPALLAEAAGLPESAAVIDIDHPSLLTPGDMVGRVHRLAAAQGIGDPSPVVVVRLVLDSLAAAYADAVETAATLAGVRPEVLHIVGGGSQNELLDQLTADACGIPVVAGPTEAAALGNVLVQARALGVGLETLADMRALLRGTQTLRRFEPTPVGSGPDDRPAKGGG